MTDVTGPVHEKPRPGRSDHRRHDRLLIVRFVAGDAPAADMRRAEATIETCRDCAALAHDLRILPAATRGLPVPPRTRDFQLSAEQAAALRGGTFDRLLRGLGAPNMGYLRPLAAAVLSLGLVLVAVGSLPLGMAATPAGAPEMELRGESAATAAPWAAASAAPAPTAAAGEGPAALQSATDGFARASASSAVPAAEGYGGYGGPASSEPGDDSTKRTMFAAGGPDAAADENGAAGPVDEAYLEPFTERDAERALAAEAGDPVRSVLVLGGLGLAVIGLGVLVAATIGRRRVDDPLLR
jgi:hypothetical protein